MDEKKTMGLWRKNGIPGGKYLVERRDGSIPEWPLFVLGARDPAAAIALRAYAEACELHSRDPEYVANVRELANDFDRYRAEHGDGDPDAPPFREDDPAIIEKMQQGGSA
jgi:hypothetical protein